MNYIRLSLLSAVLLSLTPSLVLAHVVVKPASVGVGAFQIFSIGVPVEKDIATVGVRLVIPEGLQYASPNVKPGWKIEIKKTGTGEESVVTEIVWSGGTIPPGQRDDFVFSAKVPAQTGTLRWNAYQTYSDGSVVSWDADPAALQGQNGPSDKGPYSKTEVVDDLAGSTQTPARDNTVLTIALVAFVFALSALYRTRKGAAQTGR